MLNITQGGIYLGNLCPKLPQSFFLLSSESGSFLHRTRRRLEVGGSKGHRTTSHVVEQRNPVAWTADLSRVIELGFLPGRRRHVLMICKHLRAVAAGCANAGFHRRLTNLVWRVRMNGPFRIEPDILLNF